MFQMHITAMEHKVEPNNTLIAVFVYYAKTINVPWSFQNLKTENKE